MRDWLALQAQRLRDPFWAPTSKALFGALAVSVLLMLLWWQAGRWYQTQLLIEQRSEVAVDISLQGNALSSAINRRLVRLDALDAFVQAEIQAARVSDVSEAWPEFMTFAASLYSGSTGIRSLAVAPGGVIRYVYPLVGNEDVLGYEPLNDSHPDVRAAVQRAIESREVVVSGPQELIQGGIGLMARQAVYQDGEYWGMVDIVLNLPTVLDQAGLDELSSDSDIAVALRDSDGRVLFGSGDVFGNDPVMRRIELPGEDWELAGLPSGGWWEAVRRPLLVIQTAGLIIVGLLAGVTYLSVSRQARLVLAVRQRTQELQQDIAERKRVEAVLREREEQYREIYESTSDGLFINDFGGRLVDFNPAAARMHGYTSEEFRRLQPTQFIHPDSLPVFADYIETVKAGNQFKGRAIDLRKDGTPFPIEVLGTGFTYRGQPHALAVVRDITEEVQVVQHLEEQEALRTQELTTLLVLSNRLVSTLEMEPLVELILEQLKRVVDYSGATVLVLEGAELRAAGHRGPVPPDRVAQLRVPVAEVNEFWRAMLRREPLIIDDVRAETLPAESYRQITRSYPETATGYVRAWMGIPLMVQEQLIGALSINHDQPQAFTYRHAVLAMAIANQAAIALENARLYEQARRLAVLEERQRIARELHDSVSQALYGIGMGASTARALLDRDPPQATEPLDYVIALTEAGLAEMRALIFELRPDSLEKEGLVTALNGQAAALRTRHNLEVNIECCEEPALSFEVREALYRIAQEALNNTIKHAQASKVEIRLDDREGVISLEIQDDGIGFDPQIEYPGHLGLQSMRERAARSGSTLEIESVPGRGTLIRAHVPSPGSG